MSLHRGTLEVVHIRVLGVAAFGYFVSDHGCLRLKVNTLRAVNRDVVAGLMVKTLTLTLTLTCPPDGSYRFRYRYRWQN